MASFRDPARTFNPIEVIERLLEISEYFGGKARLYLASDEELATYLDCYGFDIYALKLDTKGKFETSGHVTRVLPSGSRSHESPTAH